MKKLYPLSELSKIIQNLKRSGKRIVLANGCFDLIHVGHVRYLQESKKQGDTLVVAINSDKSAQKLKGPGRPILDQEERSKIIDSFDCVDYIMIFDEPSVEKILLTLKPHVHAKGSDYSQETVPERATVKKYGGEIAITGGPKVKSTTDLIRKISDRSA